MARGFIPKDWTGRAPPQIPASPAAGDFNRDAPEIHTIRLPLDTAQIAVRYNITGNALYVVDASSPDALARICINRPDSDTFPISHGFGLRTPPFSSIYVFNDSQAGAWLELLYMVTQFGFEIVNPGSVVATVTLAKSANFDTITDNVSPGAAATIDAADATRRRCVVKCEGPYPMRVGVSGSVSDTDGYFLDPGDSLEIFTTAALQAWGISTNPGDTNFSAIFERD